MSVAAPRLAVLTAGEVALGVAFAGTSGAALLLYVLGDLPMSFTVPFVAIPSAAMLTGLMLLRRRATGRLHAYSRVLTLGLVFGLVATVVYDAVRPAIVWAIGGTFNPYAAQPIFGTLITGLPGTDPRALAAGWTYHTWNGLSFGMIYALVRPQGGWRTGVLWGLGLQTLMMATYPALLQARLDDPAFMASGLVGHGFWGATLGIGVERWSARA